MPDNLTKAQRSYCMSQIRGKDTSIEKKVRSIIHKNGCRFRKNYSALPGKPDIVFPRKKIAVFLDGDFWHGYRFPVWKHKLPDYWQRKIENNRIRDRKHHRKLRRMGWQVLRIWEHDLKKDFALCINRILHYVNPSNTH